MKKIIISIILIFGLSFSYNNNFISIVNVQSVYAQQDQQCFNSNASPSTGFFAWLKTALSNVASAVTAVANAIGDFFSQSNNSSQGGEEFGEEDESDTYASSYEPSGPADYFENPMDNPDFPTDNLDANAMDILGSLDYWYAVYINNGSSPVQDCAGTWGGTAYTGSCGVCIGGGTGINACYVDSARTDTAQFTKIPCLPEAVARGQRLTNIRDSVNHLPEIKRLKDSAYNSLKESSVSIAKNTDTISVFSFNASSASTNVVTTTCDSIQKIIAGFHSHPKGIVDSLNKVNGPSPGDLYHLINGRLCNPNYFADFVFAHDSTEWAIMVVNDSIANHTNTLYPVDSSLQNYPIDNNWTLNKFTDDGFSFYQKYIDLTRYLLNNLHYPIEDVETLANMYFASEILPLGIKFYKKINGKFKELGYNFTYDSAGSLTGMKITICE